jgi:hypothetical protein
MKLDAGDKEAERIPPCAKVNSPVYSLTLSTLHPPSGVRLAVVMYKMWQPNRISGIGSLLVADSAPLRCLLLLVFATTN